MFDLEDFETLLPQTEATTAQNDLIDLYVDFDQESLNQIIQRLDPVSGGQFRLLKRATMPAIKADRDTPNRSQWEILTIFGS